MKLAQLLAIYPQLRWGNFANSDVLKLCDDSREVEKGSVFVAVRGESFDGHNFIGSAIDRGAIALVVESMESVPSSYQGAIVKVNNTRLALNQLAERFYGEPAKDLICIGVTGTNGKTSITYILEQILKNYGWISGVMGTINHHVGDKVWKSELTTPGTLQLQRRLAEFSSLEARAAIFEVSSHALEQARADFIPFRVAIFTNLTRDHLDYHKDMESYFQSKQKLFRELPLKYGRRKSTAVINVDDSYGKKIEVADGVKRITYGKRNADYRFQILNSDFSGSHFELVSPKGNGSFYTPLPGEHNVYNCVACIAAALDLGVSMEACRLALRDLVGIPGRLQRVENQKGIHAFVDYAHTDQALASVLRSLREIGEKNVDSYNLITVFGCGGDRDPGKRPLMMEAAKKYSDFVFLTSDNPRSEPPMKIIDDALTVVSSEEIDNNVFVEVDRRKAIERAVRISQPGDVLLVAGKGHEDYQLIGDKKIDFSDVKVLEEVFLDA